MRPELMLLTLLTFSVGVLPAEPTPVPKVTPAEWVRQQTPPRFKSGHTLPPLGQMHCINPPVELRAELARNWGFAVRLNRPKGEIGRAHV